MTVAPFGYIVGPFGAEHAAQSVECMRTDALNICYMFWTNLLSYLSRNGMHVLATQRADGRWLCPTQIKVLENNIVT